LLIDILLLSNAVIVQATDPKLEEALLEYNCRLITNAKTISELLKKEYGWEIRYVSTS
jgi:hypothetical protein